MVTILTRKGVKCLIYSELWGKVARCKVRLGGLNFIVHLLDNIFYFSLCGAQAGLAKRNEL